MNNILRSTKGARAFAAALTLATAMSYPLQTGAQEVTLKSIEGDAVNLTGTFVSFEDNVYTLDTVFGMLRIKGENVACDGESCPNTGLLAGGIVEPTGPIVWDVSLWGKRRAFTEHVEKIAELVDEKTGGQLTLKLSYGGLSPSRENLDGIANGKFEMAQFCAGYHPNKNPSITVLELPFLGVTSMEQERDVSQAVYSHPAVVEDLARWNATLLMPTPQPQYNIAGIGAPPTSLASFAGMTVRATGGTGAAINALGASSKNLPAPEVKDALKANEINAVAFAPHGHMAFNTIDSVTWWTSNLNPGTANCPVVVNTDALAALPVSSRVALLSSVDDALDHFIANYTDVTLAQWDAVLQERFIMQLQINDGILNAINEEVAGPTAEAWIKTNAEAGLPSQELYNLVVNTLRESG